MKSVKSKFGIVMGCVVGMCVQVPTGHAACPTMSSSSAEGNNAKAYIQEPDNVGTSWRLYIRPRNGACLDAPAVGYKSPSDTEGQSDGSSKSKYAEPGSKNCDDDYKSYVSVDMPSASNIYNTYVTYQSSTQVGFEIMTTKNHYQGAFALLPMTLADGTPDPNNAKVVGICFK
ncbi:hypothetical protein CCP4SC76_3690008 [Gammaproteobacteria bacterium]